MKERKSDILWKMVMEEVFEDLQRFVYSDADHVYDLERGFEFLDKELGELYPEPEKKSDTRFADQLVKVYHRDGEEEWVGAAEDEVPWAGPTRLGGWTA